MTLGFCFLGDFWSLFWFQCLLIGLFIISISSWFSHGRLTFSKNLSISSRLSILLSYSCSQYSLIIHCISILSAGTSPFSFLIFLIWYFSFFSWWVWLVICHFFYLLKEPAFNFINLCYCFLHFFFIYFYSDFYDFFPSTDFLFLLLLFFLFFQLLQM